MQIPVPDALYRFVNTSVSGGYVVATAFICLLQYVAHVHRIRQVQQEQQKCRNELSGVASRLTDVERERFLSEYENAALREFLAERTGERALRRLLQRLVPDPQAGWAALLRRRDVGWCVIQSTGLSDASVESLLWDPEWEPALARGESLPLCDAPLRDSAVWKSLDPVDQERTRQLHVFPVGSAGELDGALLTTQLLPPGFDERSQVTCVEQLVAGISGSLRDRWRLDSQQRRLHITAEMLALRSIADRHFDSPMAMLSELVQEVRDKTRSHRVALFLYQHHQGGGAQALVRSGEPLVPGIETEWTELELRLAEFGRNITSLEHFCGDEMAQFQAEKLLGAALLVPIVRHRRTVGLLCFTRADNEEYCEAQRQLGAWAANLLAEMLPRAVNHAVATRQARLDPLTGLANRRAFDRCIEEEIRLARESDGRCSLLLMDLDRFKSINDSYGHRGGDAVLRAVSQIIRDGVQQVRAADREAGATSFVARYGGEELAVLLPGLGRDAARRIGESIRAELEAAQIEFEGISIAVTVSIGLATFPEHAENVEELIAAADAALYLAKCAGRNRLEVADQALASTGTVSLLPVIP